MKNDPIVEEFREVGNAYAKSFGHDLDAIVEDIRRRQEKHPDRMVSFADGEPEMEDSQTPRSVA